MGNPIDEYITLAEIREKHLPLSRATLTRMCKEKRFQTAWKPGRSNKSPWRVFRSEVIGFQINSYPQ